MDIVENCRSYLNDQLTSLNGYIDEHVSPAEFQQTQTRVEASLRDRHNDLDLIFDQQTYVKGLIEKDERAISLRRQIREDKRTIDDIRRACAKIASDKIKNYHALEAEQSKELERFQLQLMKNIIEDQQRHTRILEQRDQELASVKSEYEREERNRPTVLENLKKSLERSLEERRKNLDQVEPSNVAGDDIVGDLMDPNYIELTSVDEYDPHRNGARIPNSRGGISKKRARGTGAAGRGGGGASARGRSGRARRGGRATHAT